MNHPHAQREKGPRAGKGSIKAAADSPDYSWPTSRHPNGNSLNAPYWREHALHTGLIFEANVGGRGAVAKTGKLVGRD